MASDARRDRSLEHGVGAVRNGITKLWGSGSPITSLPYRKATWASGSSVEKGLWINRAGQGSAEYMPSRLVGL